MSITTHDPIGDYPFNLEIAPLHGTSISNTCHIVGHQGHHEMIEYVDGVFVTYCKTCGARMVFEKVPGDLPKIRLKSLVLNEMDAQELDLEGLREVEQALALERRQLEAAEADLKLLKDMIRSRYETRIQATDEAAQHQCSELDALGCEEAAT